MSDSGHHTLQILTQPMQVFLCDFMKDTLYKNKLHKTEELKKENSAAVISISEETLATDVWNFWHQLPIVHILKMCLHDCQSQKTTELRDAKYSDVCCVIGSR